MADPITGTGGAVTKDGAAVANVDKWALNDKCALVEYVNSSTAGWTEQAAGAKSWDGSVSIQNDDGNFPTIIPGTAYVLELKIDSTNKYSGTVKFEEGGVEVSIDGSNVPTLTMKFKGHGVLTRPYS